MSISEGQPWGKLPGEQTHKAWYEQPLLFCSCTSKLHHSITGKDTFTIQPQARKPGPRSAYWFVWAQGEAEMIWVSFEPELSGPDLYPIPHPHSCLPLCLSSHLMNLWVHLEFFLDSGQVDLLFQKRGLRSISGIDFSFLGGNKKSSYRPK